jgi:hypothetical protein
MPENRSATSLLLAAAFASFGVALLHIVIMLMGAPGYRYFGAPSLAVQLEQGSSTPAILCLVVAALVSVCGLHALSGAGRIRPLPLLRTGILIIGITYFLRGLLGVPHLVYELSGRHVAPLRYLVFSAVSGVIGVLYLAGLFTRGRPTHITSEEHRAA